MRDKTSLVPVRSRKAKRYSATRNADFVHLHLHSEFSLLDGACRVSEIAAAARRAGQRAVAITDHGVMYGAVDFYKACKKAGIKPIIGCEVYVAARTMSDREHDLDLKSSHLVLLVKNETGYRNLIYLVTKAFTDGFYAKPRIDLDLLAAHSEGLCALSACLAGAIPRLITAGESEEAENYARKLNSIFGDGNFFLELQDHGIADQKTVAKGLDRIHESTGIPLVATNDVHYLKKSDAEAQSVLMCIQTNSRLSDGRPLGFETDEYYFKSTAEMYRLFGDYEQAVKNTARIADMCDFDFDFSRTFLPRFKPENGESPETYLRSLVLEGLDGRASRGDIVFTGAHPESEYRERIEYELSVINSMGYTEYYLIVRDFVHYSKTHGVMVGPGRGSGAGSLCAFLVGIVDVDPIAYGLLFERFLNPERVSMPDFDIDFPDDKRDLAIEYVRHKYGADKTAQIITFGTMASKAALRDVGRVLETPYDDVDAICAALPTEKDGTPVPLDEALAAKPFRELYESNAEIRRTVDIALRLEGMPRHASTHAAGVVIADRPLWENIPLAVNGGVAVTQFAMKNIEELGFLKFDFLALRYLTVVDNCVRFIKERDADFDIDRIPLDDAATYELISRGDTDGVFQLEKSGMKRFLTQLRPRCLNDVIAAISFYRPGPMDSIPKYLENRADPSKITYATPLLEPILSETYGCIVFQEQVMQIFRTLAGYSFGRADIVRRAISKKKTEVLEAERRNFIEGAQKNGVPPESATALFEEIVKFAEYAYNKSHATAYAIVTYRTAYLKCCYGREYICALLTSVMNDPAKVAAYISAAKSRGIRFCAPSVNESGVEFRVVGDRIVFGLDAIKNLGKASAEKIAAEVAANGRFTSIADFISRAGGAIGNRRQLEFLIKSGALDGLGANRRQLLTVVDLLAELASPSSFGRVEGQVDMFSAGLEQSGLALPEMPNVAEYSAKDLLALEKESVGIYLSGHILDDYSDMIRDISPTPIAQIVSAEKDAVLSAATVCAEVRRRSDKTAKNGGAMAFVSVEDSSGELEVVVFQEQLRKYGRLLAVDAALALSGKISKRGDEAPRLILDSARLLYKNSNYRGEHRLAAQNAPQAAPKDGAPKKLFVKLDLGDEALKKRVFSLISIFDDGEDFALFYDTSRGDYDRDTALRCSAGDFLVAQLREILGDENVVVR